MIVIENLSKRFGKKVVFDGLCLTFDDTGITALTGESGCGKTTLLRLISGLDKKYSGKISLGSIKRISYVFQEPRLLKGSTALENVALPLGNTEEAKKTAEEWLIKMGLGSELNTYPEEMSGGMKQRVSIARALAYDGDLLLLDEAFNGIDKNRCLPIMEEIIEYAKKKPCILVTHNQEHIDYFKCKTVKL